MLFAQRSGGAAALFLWADCFAGMARALALTAYRNAPYILRSRRQSAGRIADTAITLRGRAARSSRPG